MHGTVRRWGGSLAIRLNMDAARQANLEEGMEVDFELTISPLDFDSLPTVKDLKDAAERHDELLNEHH